MPVKKRTNPRNLLTFSVPQCLHNLSEFLSCVFIALKGFRVKYYMYALILIILF